MSDTPEIFELSELVKVVDHFDSTLRQIENKSRTAFLKNGSRELRLLEQKEKYLKVFKHELERIQAKMASDKVLIEEELLLIADWKLYETRKAEGAFQNGYWVVVCAPSVLANEKDEKAALVKLNDAPRKCLLVQVGDEKHVYEVSTVQCVYEQPKSAWFVQTQVSSGPDNQTQALFKVDTGACICTLSSEIIQTLNLKPKSAMYLSGAFDDQPIQKDVFLVTIEIDQKRNDLVKCVESSGSSLLGMSVLSSYTLTMSNSSRMELTALQ